MWVERKSHSSFSTINYLLFPPCLLKIVRIDPNQCLRTRIIVSFQMQVYNRSRIVCNVDVLFLDFKDYLQRKCVRLCWVCAIWDENSDLFFIKQSSGRQKPKHIRFYLKPPFIAPELSDSMDFDLTAGVVCRSTSIWLEMLGASLLTPGCFSVWVSYKESGIQKVSVLYSFQWNCHSCLSEGRF